MLQVEEIEAVLSARVHPTATIEAGVLLGPGASVWHHAQVRERAWIGANCIIGKGAFIDIDVHVGANCKIQNYALIYHGSTIGNGVFIGPAAVLTNDLRPRAITPSGVLQRGEDWQCGQIIVEDGASIGAGAIILPGLRIGRYALVGAGAVVTHDVPAHALVVGNPARQIDWVCRCGERLRAGLICQDCGDSLERIGA
jgi:UDP-2-acetamido-3-amino-2,3-dideoxy-glucuronate N-acetyltransferase